MAGPIRISILANGSQARREATLTARAYSGLGRTLGRGGALVGITSLTAAAVGFTKASIQTEAVFSQTMNTLAAATGATAREIKALNDQAIQLGQDTSFSANEAAEAMLELGRAGQTTTQITKSVPEVLNLAATEGMGLADAAGVVTSALAQFQLGARDSAGVVNALAGASNASRSSVSSLGESFKLVGSSANGIGLSVQETAGALAALSQSGLDGSVAGTSLSAVFNRLIPTTDRARTAMEKLDLNFVKADGSFKDIDDIAQQLQDSLGGLSDAKRKVAIQDMFGNDASTISAVNALVQAGGDGLREYTKAASDNSAALKLSKARMEGTAGALERLSGTIDTAKLVLGQELAPVVVAAADGLGDRLVPGLEGVIDGAKSMARDLKPATDAVAEGLREVVPTGADLTDTFNEMVPAIIALAESAAAIAPVISEGTTTLADFAPSAAEVASTVSEGLVPAVEGLSDVVDGILGFIGDLPGPVKEIGVQAGIAALVLPRFAAGVTTVTSSVALNIARLQQFRAELTYTATRAQQTALMMQRLGGAARAAAGIGGLVVLTQATNQTSDGLKLLGATAGGALLGFSVGGPWGAAIGAGAGALYGLASATTESAVEMVEAEDIARRYADTMDRVTGSITKQTREAAFQRMMEDDVTRKLIETLNKYGVSSRTVVDAALGQKDAFNKLRQTHQAAADEYDRIVEKFNPDLIKELGEDDVVGDSWAERRALEAKDLRGALQLLIPKLEAEQKSIKASSLATREKALVTENLRDVFKGLPREAITKIRADGVPTTLRDVARLTRRYDLTPKQIRTTLRAIGIDKSVADVQRLARRLDETGRRKTSPKVEVDTKGAKADLGGWERDLIAGLTQGKQRAEVGSRDIKRGVEAGPANARADLSTLIGGIRSGTNQARTIGSSGGREAGSALGAGLYYGVDSWATSIANRAASIVRAAVTAAKNAGRVKSPSRETYYVGDMLGLGLVRGVADREKDAKGGGKNIVRALLAGVTNGAQGVESALEKLTKHIDKTFDQQLAATEKRLRGKLKGRALDKALRETERANERARKAALKGLRDERAALIANGKAQDANTRKLEAAVQKHKQLVQQAKDYSASIRQGFVDYGSVTNLGQDTGFANSDQMLAQLRARAAQAQRYAQMIRQLQAAGLNRTTIDQLLQAGVEGGFGTAQTILAGGQSAIAEINRLTAQIASTGGSLGDRLAKTYYGAGIQAAEGLVKGLEQRQKQLDRVADRLASQMVKAVKKALGIKSPSRVFMGIGDQTVRGLEIGLDETYVRRAGARLAGSLQQGFGSPALAAYTATAGAGALGAPQVIRLHLTSDVVDQVRRGKEVLADADAAIMAGERPLRVLVSS